MAQTKYQIFKNEDAVKYLNDEQKAQLTNIIATIATGRRQDGKTLGDLMFVLNASKPGEQARVAVIRDGKSLEVEVTFQESQRPR